MIPVYKPWLTDLEKKYLNEAFDSSWISSTGKFIDKAEELFKNFIGVKYCTLVSSGTTALHLSFRALEPYKSNTVVIPNITFIASAFAAAYDNHKIKLIDVDINTWNLDLGKLDDYLNKEEVDVVMMVHLYGNPGDMERLLLLQKKYEFKIIEDSCEALGAKLNGQTIGSFGNLSCFSFYGNKTFTCGEGGAIVTNDELLNDKVKFLRGQAQDKKKRYWHTDIGYNYRMTNMQAAILCGQLERVEDIIAEKNRVADRYFNNLKDYVKFQLPLPNSVHSNWLITIILEKGRDYLMKFLKDNGVDSRKVFYPINSMPPFKTNTEKFKTSSFLSNNGLSLPSYPTLTNKEIDFICSLVIQAIKNINIK